MKIEKTFLKEIEKYSVPGVWGLVNEDTKECWLSYSQNVLEAIQRNLKSGGCRIITFDHIILEKLPENVYLRNHFVDVCREYETRGYKLLNTRIKYKVWGEVGVDYRTGNQKQFLYYVWLGTKNYRMEPLGVFEKTKDGEDFKKSLVDTNSFKPFTSDLTTNYRKTWRDLEYEGVFGKKDVVVQH